MDNLQKEKQQQKNEPLTAGEARLNKDALSLQTWNTSGPAESQATCFTGIFALQTQADRTIAGRMRELGAVRPVRATAAVAQPPVPSEAPDETRKQRRELVKTQRSQPRSPDVS